MRDKETDREKESDGEYLEMLERECTHFLNYLSLPEINCIYGICTFGNVSLPVTNQIIKLNTQEKNHI